MIFVAYSLLIVAMLSCFWPQPSRRLPLALGAAALLTGWAANLITYSAIPVLAALAALSLGYERTTKRLQHQPQRLGLRWFARGQLLLVASILLLLAMHKLPGFQNVLLLDQVQVSQDAIPFTLYANVDKGLAGFVLLVLLWPLSQPSPQPLQAAAPQDLGCDLTLRWLRGWWPLFPLTFLCSEMIAVAFGFITWDPKLPAYTLTFLAVNLFLTCVAEELFFRGLLQTALQRWLARRGWPLWLAAVVIGLLFGAAHLGGGVPYAITVTVAGIGYGLMYLRSGRIEVAILGHFALNALHFLLFSYPMLAN